MPDESQQPIYTPTDILNIVKEHLRTSNIPVVVEGVYMMIGTKAYNGGIWWYDEIRSQFDNSKLKAMVPTSIRDQEYPISKSVFFHKKTDDHWILSNMATAPLVVNGIHFSDINLRFRGYSVRLVYTAQ